MPFEVFSRRRLGKSRGKDEDIFVRIELSCIILSPASSKHGKPGPVHLLWDREGFAAIAPAETGEWYLVEHKGSLRVFARPFLEATGMRRAGFLPAKWNSDSNRWEWRIPMNNSAGSQEKSG
jgi:hypothetical protein